MTDIILTVINLVKGFITFLIPDALFAADVFTNFWDYINFFIDIIVKVNFLIPVRTIFTCFTIMVSIRIIKFTIFVTNWFIRSVLELLP